ncbi:MAG TPA: hypothetical protein VN428_25075, partial [Bryobacteraceae bacterium]|nr:hypothetical protein [Bryobacteraceae bacterium]
PAGGDPEDIRSELLLSFLLVWPRFNPEIASVQTFASRVMDRELMSIVRRGLAFTRREQELPPAEPRPSDAARRCFRIDFERALEPLPVVVKQTAVALCRHSTTETAKLFGCSRQMIHIRKLRIRQALASAGIEPRYFSEAGSR